MGRLLRQLGYVAAVAVACFYVFAALRGPNGIPHALEKREEMQLIEKENERLRLEIKEREEYLKKLKTDQETRERAIREHTNKQKPDETTIYLPDETPRKK